MALCGAVSFQSVAPISLMAPFGVATIIFPAEPPDLVSVAYAPPRKPAKA